MPASKLIELPELNQLRDERQSVARQDREDVDPGILLRPSRPGPRRVIKGALAEIVRNQPARNDGFDQPVGYIAVQHQVML